MWGRARQKVDDAEVVPVVSLASGDEVGVNSKAISTEFLEITSDWNRYHPRKDIENRTWKVKGLPKAILRSFIWTFFLVWFLVSMFSLIQAVGDLPVPDDWREWDAYFEEEIPKVVMSLEYLHWQTIYTSIVVASIAGLFRYLLAQFLNFGPNKVFRSRVLSGLAGGIIQVYSGIWVGSGQIQFGCGKKGMAVRNWNSFAYFVWWSKIECIYPTGRNIDVDRRISGFVETFVDEIYDPSVVGPSRGAVVGEVREFLGFAMKNRTRSKDQIRIRLKARDRLLSGIEYNIGDELVIPNRFFGPGDIKKKNEFLDKSWRFSIEQSVRDNPRTLEKLSTVLGLIV